MRFAVFFTLLVATFVACSSFVSAENVANNEARRLRAEHGFHGHHHVHAPAAVASLKELPASVKIAAGFISHLNEGKILREAAKMKAGAKEASKFSPENMAKLSKMVAESAKNDAKSGPRLSKALKITLGVGAGAAVMIAAYKLMNRQAATQAPATSVMDGSA